MSERNLKVVELPQHSVADVASHLRVIAEKIERGEFGQAHNLVWVIDTGDGKIEIGLLGQAGEPAAVTHLLLALGQKKLLDTLTA